MGEDPAFEVRTELPLDEAGHRVIAFSGAREEGLELLANDGVQLGLFRAASFVGPRGSCSEEAGGRGAGAEVGGHSRCALRAACRAVGSLLMRARSLAGSRRERTFTPNVLRRFWESEAALTEPLETHARDSQLTAERVEN